METTRISVKGKLDKQTVTYSYNEILFDYKKIKSKKNLLKHIIGQKNLKNIILKERSQIQNNTYCMRTCI